MKTFIQLFIFLFFILFTTTLHSQKEYNEWVLGNKLDITFNTDNGELALLNKYYLFDYFDNREYMTRRFHYNNRFHKNRLWGCMPSVICDSNGNVKYFSYKNRLYNELFTFVNGQEYLKTGQMLVVNNIDPHYYGWEVALQSSIILKIKDTYIRVNNNSSSGTSGLTYSIIEDNHLKDINTNIKTSYQSSSLYAIKNFENSNYWVITYDNNNNSYEVYNTDENGVNKQLTSSFKSDKQINCTESKLIKASPNGEYIINVFENCDAEDIDDKKYDSYFELLEFDPLSGKIGNVIYRYFTKYASNAEFSLNSKKLYLAEKRKGYHDASGFEIQQYDIINKTQKPLNLFVNIGADQMQLGPDGKIYYRNRNHLSNFWSNVNRRVVLHKIVNPESEADNVIANVHIPRMDSVLMHDFPNIPTSAYLKLYTPTVLRACIGDSVQLRAIAQYHNFPDTNYVWTGPNGFYSEEQNPILMDLSPADEGVYKVKVFGGETIDSGETYVQVFPTPEPRIEAHPSTFSCDGEAITLVADEDYGSYLWSTGETTKSIEVSEAGEYYLTIEDENACIGSTSIAVGFGGDIVILGDTLICQGESTILSAGDDFTEYLWSTGETTKSIEVSEAGKYTLKIKTEEGCEAEASINVSYHPEVIAELRSHEQELCYGESVDLVSRYDLPHWEMRWSTGEEGKEIKVIESGLYKLYIEDLETGCKDSTETQIWIEEEITAGIQGANICEGEETELIAEPQGEDYSYVWSTGETTSSIKVIESGNYSVKISKGKCESEAEIEIEVYPMPELAIVGEREICQGETTILSANEDYESYEWSTGERTKSIEAKGGEYSLRVWTEDGCSITESVIVKEKSSEIEFESLVYDFGKVYLTETRDTIIEGRNISENDIIIETQIINPEDYYRIDYSLNPQTTGPYREIIELRVEEPCPRTYQIELLAEIYTRVKLSAPELEVEIGESDLRIPYYIESETNLGEKNFTAQVEISKEVYHTEDPYTVIKSHNIQIDKTEFHSQTGIVLLASLEEYPISFSNINFEDPYIEIEEDPGLLILNEICIHDARLIELIEPTKAYVSPNPAGESLKVRIESEERGEIEIELLDASGMRVYAQRLTNSRAEINIPTKSFSSGVYILKINTARAHLEKRIMIVR